MKITCFSENYKLGDPCVAAFGCFDGVHTGHRALISSAKSCAEKEGLPVIVWTLNIPRPDRLTSEEEKDILFRSLTVDAAIHEEYETIRDLSPGEFLNKVKKELGVEYFFCGYNFTFGKGRAGNTRTLSEECGKFGIVPFVLPRFTLSELDDGNVSSSDVRAALGKGDVKTAGVILGRAVSYKGTVKSGHTVGRKLGFPTANIYPEKGILLPRFGVYATELEVDGKSYPSLTNIGVRPTFGESEELIETYVITNDVIDLYGKEITVTLLQFVRDEKKFSSPEELSSQIAEDLKTCEKIRREIKI